MLHGGKRTTSGLPQSQRVAELLGDLRLGKVKVQTSAGTFALPEDPVFWASFVLQGEP